MFFEHLLPYRLFLCKIPCFLSFCGNFEVFFVQNSLKVVNIFSTQNYKLEFLIW